MRLLLALALASPFLAACGKDPGGPVAPAAWDLSRQPDAGPVLREVPAPGGIVAKVVKEGEGDESKRGDVLDLRFAARLEDGTTVDEGTWTGVVLGGERRLDRPSGLEYGVAGMRVGEKRRLLVPATQGWSVRATPTPAAVDKRFVLDVERIAPLQVGVVDLQLAAGREARLGDTIKAHYKGTLPDGKTFDSSFDRKKPIEIKLVRGDGGVIEGWIRGIPGMRVGGRRVLRIPAALAYGKHPPPRSKIPADSDLEFEIELLEVK